MAEEASTFVTFLKKEQNSIDAWDFYFRKPTGFRYTAGQYIKMKLPIKNPDNRGNSRYFTLSSSPTEEFLKVTTRIIKSSFKMELNKLQDGDKVELRGPWGDFVLDEKDTRTRVFLAGGIGLTPYHSMMKYATDSKLNVKIILFVSYSSEKGMLFQKEFEEMVSKNKNIQIVVTITKPGPDWKGEVGRITKELLEKHLDMLSEYVYYVSGPDPMIAGLKKILTQKGISEDTILEDGFPGYKAIQ